PPALRLKYSESFCHGNLGVIVREHGIVNTWKTRKPLLNSSILRPSEEWTPLPVLPPTPLYSAPVIKKRALPGFWFAVSARRPHPWRKRWNGPLATSSTAASLLPNTVTEPRENSKRYGSWKQVTPSLTPTG